MTFANFLRRVLPHKELGWAEIEEEFTRFTLLKTPWFGVYLHRLYAPLWHPQGHDHPWDFVVILLRNGYIEWDLDGMRPRYSGDIFRHRAEYAHNVKTHSGVTWSLMITGPKRREWSFVKLPDAFPRRCNLSTTEHPHE